MPTVPAGEFQPGTPDTGPLIGVVMADGFAAAVAELVAAAQTNTATPQTVLQLLVDGAAALIPGVQGAGILTVAGRDRLTAEAASGELPPLVLKLQNEAGVGPCWDAVTQGETVLIVDTAAEPRWPDFTPKVLELGVRSMLCVPLTAGRRVLGSLSLVSTAAAAYTAESLEAARIFAVHAAAMLAADRARADFQDGLARRDVIGQAKGMLVERFRITPEVAFSVLLRTSQHTNRKLRDVCQQLCDSGELPV